MIYLQLAFEFFKIGLFSIGGGMATLPFLMDLTKKYNWYTASELANIVAISESTPGPVGVNMATYAGYNAAGIPGALIATLSLTAPALIIVGFLMFTSVATTEFGDLTEAIPAYITIIAMPFFYSISEGISMGVISYVVLNLLTGKAKEKKISILMYVLAVLFILKYIFL